MINITHTLTSQAARLFLFSFLVLFVELALIRWLGAHIIFLSYFSNFILLGSFLGIGAGFLQAKSSIKFYKCSPILFALLILCVIIFPINIVYYGSGLNRLSILGDDTLSITGFPVWVVLPFIFILVTAVMASIAHGVAVSFNHFKPLVAYRLDILGALSGIMVFSALAYFHLPPIGWGIVVFIIFQILFFKEWRSGPVTLLAILQMTALYVIVGVLAYESLQVNQYWTPYYQVSLKTGYDRNGKYIDVAVNKIPHQRIQSVERRKKREPYYFLPYQHNVSVPLDNVLIIGAGTGGDTAIALANGAKKIDAVEIDPVIYELGQRLNPDQPYADAKVTAHINDGRAFLQQSHELYDLIIFALPDSLTLVSGQSSLRLESYLFTQEAIAAAKKHLKPNGILTMYNYYWQPWLIDRLANTLQTAFHESPCLDIVETGVTWRAVLTVSATPSVLNCARHWMPLTTEAIDPATDNHPFLYLQKHEIPYFYQVTLLMILLVSVIVTVCSTKSLKAFSAHADLFFMGMAFLLLETKSIVAFSLLFGNTWIVNALVFTGILVMVYLAIETIQRYSKVPYISLYCLLLVALVLEWVIPLSCLLSLPVIIRFVAATLLIFSPVYFANLIFASRFQRESSDSAVAFGVNMIGAMIGGVLEYLALITGYHFLLILIAIFYTLAFFLGKKTKLPFSISGKA
jgi:hypothetical protein